MSDIKFLSANEIYRIASEEVKKSDISHKIAAKAVAMAYGNKEIAENLYIKFQYEEVSKREAFQREEREERERKEREFADKRWQRQMELECKEIELAEKWRQLKRQRKLEFHCIERKFETLGRWGLGIGLIAGIMIGIVWFFVYEEPSQVSFISTRNPSFTAMPANYDSAKVASYLKAAEQGDTLAQDILGYLYANGEGVDKDKVQAVIWYRKAAEQGNINAQFNLAVAYKNGIGLPKDDVQAVKWFGKAATQGDAEAQTILGKIYEYGLLGVKQDELQAEAWYQKAAEQGSQEALDALVHLDAWLRD